MAQAYSNALTTGQVVVRKWWVNTNSAKNQITVQFQQEVERPASAANANPRGVRRAISPGTPAAHGPPKHSHSWWTDEDGRLYGKRDMPGTVLPGAVRLRVTVILVPAKTIHDVSGTYVMQERGSAFRLGAAAAEKEEVLAPCRASGARALSADALSAQAQQTSAAMTRKMREAFNMMTKCSLRRELQIVPLQAAWRRWRRGLAGAADALRQRQLRSALRAWKRHADGAAVKLGVTADGKSSALVISHQASRTALPLHIAVSRWLTCFGHDAHCSCAGVRRGERRQEGSR